VTGFAGIVLTGLVAAVTVKALNATDLRSSEQDAAMERKLPGSPMETDDKV
jgi:hypothetical protein